MVTKLDKITGKEKKRKLNFRIDETLYKAIKIFLYESHQIGKLSTIIRDLLYNYIRAERGSKFMINPLWQKERDKLHIIDSLKERFNIADSLDAELKRLEQKQAEMELTEQDIEEPNKNELITHKKLPKFIKRKGSNTWTCRVCEIQGLNSRGLHFHKCIKKNPK